MKKDNIAIVGLGYWGTIVTNTIISMGLFQKIYIYDKDKLKIKILKKKFGNKIFQIEFNEILNNKNIKNIFLATPPKNNFEILKLLIRAKKNILVEKPGLINLKFFKQIDKELKKNKIKLTFGYIYIYNSYIRHIKKIISSKKLGAIKYINFVRQNFGPIRNNVSAAYDLATHDISILSYFFNQKIKLKNFINHNILKKKNYDISFLNLEVNKVKVDINVSWLCPEKIRKIIIIGSKKMLLFDEMNLDAPLKIYNNYVNFPKIDKFSKFYFNQSKYIFKGKSNSIKLNTTNPLNNEIREFITSDKNITDLKFSKKIIKIINKID